MYAKASIVKLIKLNKFSIYTIFVWWRYRTINDTVVYLTPCHPDLYPFEMIWSDVKIYVASRNTNFKLPDVQVLCKDKFSTIGHDQWKLICNQFSIDRNELLNQGTSHRWNNRTTYHPHGQLHQGKQLRKNWKRLRQHIWHWGPHIWLKNIQKYDEKAERPLCLLLKFVSDVYQTIKR